MSTVRLLPYQRAFLRALEEGRPLLDLDAAWRGRRYTALAMTAAEIEARWKAAQPSVSWRAPLDLQSTPPEPVRFFSDRLQTGLSARVLSQIPPVAPSATEAARKPLS